MKVGSLFAGIGGLELGLERAGMEVVWQVEIDDFCNRVLEKHWPDVKRYRDVREVGKHNLEPVDLICGGFPCQPVSKAGKGMGQEDERWLWPEFSRVVGEIRPRFVLMENVPALLVRGMGDILGDMAAIGFDAEWDCLPAGAFGARHKRDRTFLVAHPTGDGVEGGYIKAAPGWRTTSRVAPLTTSPVRWDITEPCVCRATDGIPNRVDRLRSLGNAVVPQVAEWIGRRIMEFSRPTLSGDR